MGGVWGKNEGKRREIGARSAPNDARKRRRGAGGSGRALGDGVGCVHPRAGELLGKVCRREVLRRRCTGRA